MHFLFAYMLSTSGATANLDEDAKGGIEIALSDHGPFLKHEIELVGEDSLCSSAGGGIAAQKIAADPTIVGVIGISCSRAAAAAIPILSRRLCLRKEVLVPKYYRQRPMVLI
ncbi:hypothetical protein KFU94_27365 [Chloroflexi bacterium TSY]|nr:hypothetical protein [Chloroflexi bacterium TSY]